MTDTHCPYPSELPNLPDVLSEDPLGFADSSFDDVDLLLAFSGSNLTQAMEKSVCSQFGALACPGSVLRELGDTWSCRVSLMFMREPTLFGASLNGQVMVGLQVSVERLITTADHLGVSKRVYLDAAHPSFTPYATFTQTYLRNFLPPRQRHLADTPDRTLAHALFTPSERAFLAGSIVGQTAGLSLTHLQACGWCLAATAPKPRVSALVVMGAALGGCQNLRWEWQKLSWSWRCRRHRGDRNEVPHSATYSPTVQRMVDDDNVLAADSPAQPQMKNTTDCDYEIVSNPVLDKSAEATLEFNVESSSLQTSLHVPRGSVECTLFRMDDPEILAPATLALRTICSPRAIGALETLRRGLLIALIPSALLSLIILCCKSVDTFWGLLPSIICTLLFAYVSSTSQRHARYLQSILTPNELPGDALCTTTELVAQPSHVLPGVRCWMASSQGRKVMGAAGLVVTAGILVVIGYCGVTLLGVAGLPDWLTGLLVGLVTWSIARTARVVTIRNVLRSSLVSRHVFVHKQVLTMLGTGLMMYLLVPFGALLRMVGFNRALVSAYTDSTITFWVSTRQAAGSGTLIDTLPVGGNSTEMEQWEGVFTMYLAILFICEVIYGLTHGLVRHLMWHGTTRSVQRHFIPPAALEAAPATTDDDQTAASGTSFASLSVSRDLRTERARLDTAVTSFRCSQWSDAAEKAAHTLIHAEGPSAVAYGTTLTSIACCGLLLGGINADAWVVLGVGASIGYSLYVYRTVTQPPFIEWRIEISTVRVIATVAEACLIAGLILGAIFNTNYRLVFAAASKEFTSACPPSTALLLITLLVLSAVGLIHALLDHPLPAQHLVCPNRRRNAWTLARHVRWCTERKVVDAQSVEDVLRSVSQYAAVDEDGDPCWYSESGKDIVGLIRND